jgi:hypothetical protein
VDRIEKRYRFLRLVRLQWTDKVQFDARTFRKQWRPLRFRLLNAVFTENTLAGSDHGLNRIWAKSLRHRNQGHFRRIALRIAASTGNLRTNMFEPICSDNGHALAISQRLADRYFK